MKKLFVNASFNGTKKLLKVLYETEVGVHDLKNAVTTAYGIEEEVVFTTNSDIIIENEDVLDYIEQYKSNMEFVLYIRGNKPEDNVNNVSLMQAISNNSLAIPTASGDQLYSLSDDNLVFNLFNTFNTQEELQDFLKINGRILLTLYKSKQGFSNSDRVALSKLIIRHLVDLDPQKQLHKQDFEKLSQLIVKVFPTELSSTYYSKYVHNRLANGKLWDAYNNYRALLSKSGILQRRSRSKSNINSSEVNSITNILDLDLKG